MFAVASPLILTVAEFSQEPEMVRELELVARVVVAGEVTVGAKGATVSRIQLKEAAAE